MLSRNVFPRDSRRDCCLDISAVCTRYCLHPVHCQKPPQPISLAVLPKVVISSVIVTSILKWTMSFREEA